MPEFIIRAEETDLFFLFKDYKELIRCKDCRFGHLSELVEEKIICKYGGYGKSSQDWCSWAERKEK